MMTSVYLLQRLAQINYWLVKSSGGCVSLYLAVQDFFCMHGSCQSGLMNVEVHWFLNEACVDA